MKYAVALLLLFVTISLFAQYPDGGRRSRLGYATTGDGLIVRGDGAPNYTPNSIKNAYAYIDTTNNRVFYFANGAWRKLSEEKYLYRQDETVSAAAVADSLLGYDRLFFAMELTSGASSNKAVQLPVTGLDSTYAGKVVRVAAMDSSGTYGIDIVASQPDGLALGDSLAISYSLTNGEVVEFQLYKYDSIYQWRLISSSIGGGGGGDGNGIISALPSITVVIDANGNTFRIDSLGSLIFLVNDASNSASGRLVVSGASTTPSDFGHVVGSDTALVRAIAQNVNLESQIELKAETIYKPAYISKATTTSFSALSGINLNGFEVKVHPDSLPKILALLDTVAALRTAIEAEQDTSQVLRDSIEDLRAAITSLQSSSSLALNYFEFDIGSSTGWLIATDTTGLNFSISSGTATFTIPSGVASYNLSFNGQDADLPGNDLTIVINQTSSVINQSGTTSVPRHFEVISRPDASSTPSSSAPFVYGSPTSPQRRIEGQSAGNVTLKVVNIKNAYDFWTVSLIK